MAFLSMHVLRSLLGRHGVTVSRACRARYGRLPRKPHNSRHDLVVARPMCGVAPAATAAAPCSTIRVRGISSKDRSITAVKVIVATTRGLFSPLGQGNHRGITTNIISCLPCHSSRRHMHATRQQHKKNTAAVPAVEHNNSVQARIARLRKRILTPSFPVYAVLAGGVLVAYGLVKTGFTVASFFSHTNLAHVGELAFGAGFITCMLAGGTVVGLRHMLILRPEPAYKRVLQRVVKDHRVIKKLGTPCKAGTFRAYTLAEGGPRLKAEPGVDYVGWDRWWRPRAIQMIFQVSGPDGKHAMISAEIENKMQAGDYHYNVLAMDMMDTGERIVLAGDSQKVPYRGAIKLR